MTADVKAQYAAVYSSSNVATVAVTTPPATGEVVYVIVMSDRSTPRGITGASGLGATWTRVDAAVDNRMAVFRGTGATTSGNVSVTFDGTQGWAIAAWTTDGAATTVSASYTTSSATPMLGPADSAGNGQLVLALGFAYNSPLTWPASQTPSGAYTTITAGNFVAAGYAEPTTTADHQIGMGFGTGGASRIAQAVIGDIAAGGTTVTGGQAAETDTAQVGTTAVGAVVTGGQASETDTAQGGTTSAGAVVPGSQAAETDTAQSGTVTTGEVVSGGQAAESDTAHGGTVTAGAVVQGEQATETDTAQAGSVPSGEVVAGGMATETDTAAAGIVSIVGGASTTDTANDAHKLTLGGWGVAEWEPAVVHAPASSGIRHSVISAIAYGPVTFDPANPTQPVFTYSEADAPRLRERVLLGGRDITFDRDVPLPEVEYQLSDVLLYGPGSLELPAYMASWEVGTDALARATQGRKVKVQLVDDLTDPEHPTVEATLYKGFVMNPSVSGRHLVLELGGEAQGRLTLRDAKVLFRDVLDISRLLWAELRDVGVRYLPRLGDPGLGISTLNFGGQSKYEKFQELLVRAIKKDGTQRAVLPGEDGVYRPLDKDTTTVHFSVFVDDAFTVLDVDSDISEKPNSIYATAVTPSGRRIDGAAVAGLVQTPAPDYPMNDDSSFGVGTTNEDTDSGDGVTVLVRRLGAVGLLTVDDAPGGYDDDVVDALAKLQRKARLTGPVGVMTPALWRVLWDLDQTGRSRKWASIQPTAQDPSVQRYLRSASGAVIGLNPDYDPDAIQVDESIDMGTGLRERQVENWAETRVHAPDEKVWYGTLTVNMGAVLAGQVDVGDTITSADLVDARLVQPGRHNVYVPNFDGGTLFGVSGGQRQRDGSIVFTIDTRHRPAREIWERRQVRKDTRHDPARRALGTRQSTQNRDAVHGFIGWGGILDRDVALAGGSWTKTELVAGDYGTLARFRTVVQDITSDGGDVVITGHEHAVVLFGKPRSADSSMTVARMNDLVPNPLAEDGDRPFRRRATRSILHAHGLLDAWGTHDEPAGYEGDLKSDDAVLTGVEEVTDIPFEGADGYRLDVFVWVATDTTLRGGRMAWPLIEAGT